MKNLEIRVTGTVQGVNFRSTAHETANKYGLKGFVQNNDDGSVSIEVEGEGSGLQSFVAWIQNETPEEVDVKDIEIFDGEVKHYEEFSIE